MLSPQPQASTTFGFFQRLDDFSWHGSNVRPAVTANFAFIAHPAQRDTNKFAPRSFGD
jgi:hypothetical protein